MANDKHLAMLKKGVRAWNKWRRENPNVQPGGQERQRVAIEVLPILCKPSAAVEPSKGAFDDPTAWKHHESFHPIGALDDFSFDGGYQGPDFQKALAKILPQLETEIVKRSDRMKGFVVLPRRWVVERTFAWLNRCRRLAKDWENLNRNALAFLRLASIRLMLRKLCNPA